MRYRFLFVVLVILIFLFIGCGKSTVQAISANIRPVFHLTFDQGIPTIVGVFGSPSTVKGISGLGLLLDGNSYLTLNENLDYYDQATFSVWIRTTESGRIITKRSIYSQYDLFINSQGKTDYYDGIERIGNSVLTDGKWHMVTVVLNGAHSKIYVDGRYDGKTFTVSGTRDRAKTIIGSFVTRIPNNAFYGMIDELKIFGRPLTDQEVMNEFRNYDGCRSDDSFKTRYVEVELEGLSQIDSSIYSNFHAAILQNQIIKQINLDSDLYTVWVRSKATAPINMKILSHSSTINPQQMLGWTKIGNYFLTNFKLEALSTNAIIDSIVFTNNLEWQPENAIVVYKEVEKMSLDPQSANQIKRNVWATSNDAAVWIMDTASAQLQLPSSETYHVWLREFNNGQRTLDVQLNNGPVNKSQYTIHIWDWWYVGKVSGTTQLNVILKRTDTYPGGGDVLVATTSSTWKPLSTQLDQLGVNPIPEDIKSDIKMPSFNGPTFNNNLLMWNEAIDGTDNIKTLLFLNPGTQKLNPNLLKSWSESLWKKGIDGVMTIEANWFAAESEFITTIPAWKEAIIFAKGKGLTSFFTKTAIAYRNYIMSSSGTYLPPSEDQFLPDWFDDNAWNNQINTFRAITNFTKEIGAQGIGIDIERYSASAGHSDYDMAFLWDVNKWSSEHTEQEIFNKVKQRARAVADVMLAEYPNIEFMIYPAYTYVLYNQGNTEYGALAAAWILGFLEANPSKKVILSTEYHYLLTDPTGKTSIDSFAQELRATEQKVRDLPFLSGKNFGFNHGIWPMGINDPMMAADVFERKLQAHFQESDSYVWFYSEQDSWKDEKYVQYFNVVQKMNPAVKYNIYSSSDSSNFNFCVPQQTTFGYNIPFSPRGSYMIVRAEDRAGNEDNNLKIINAKSSSFISGLRQK